MAERSDFAGGDQRYLRDVQYGDAAKLTTRIDLHSKYSTAPVAWFAWVAGQIDWPPGADVLEVGCGSGLLWAEAPTFPAGLRLTLTDLSPGMVETARERVSALPQFASVEAREADAQDLPFDDDSFDVVVANAMLYHVPDPAAGVAELARVLRPDGVLMASTIGDQHLKELWEIRTEVFGADQVRETTEVFGSVTGEPILRQRFATVEWRDYDDELACTDPADVIAFVTSTPPGEEASEAELADLREAVDRRFADGDGVFTVSKESGLFLAADSRTG